MLQLPDAFIQTITTTFSDGAQWLKELPDLITECEARWSITVGSPFQLSYNFVAPAVHTSGEEVVLKLGVPNPELTSEIEALRLCHGEGMVPLLEANAERGILLMERVRPGRMLAELQGDEEATRIAARVMRQVWRPLPAEHPFHSLQKWTGGIKRLRKHFDGGIGPFPQHLVEMAERVFEEHLSDMGETVLLHGDLHHYNILSAADKAWVVIDPKGLAGEAVYDVAPFLQNPSPRLATNARVQERRVAIFAEELGFDKQRMVRWGAAYGVLSAWWSYEDAGYGWEPAIACAETLYKLT